MSKIQAARYKPVSKPAVAPAKKHVAAKKAKAPVKRAAKKPVDAGDFSSSGKVQKKSEPKKTPAQLGLPNGGRKLSDEKLSAAIKTQRALIDALGARKDDPAVRRVLKETKQKLQLLLGEFNRRRAAEGGHPELGLPYNGQRLSDAQLAAGVERQQKLIEGSNGAALAKATAKLSVLQAELERRAALGEGGEEIEEGGEELDGVDALAESDGLDEELAGVDELMETDGVDGLDEDLDEATEPGELDEGGDSLDTEALDAGSAADDGFEA